MDIDTDREMLDVLIIILTYTKGPRPPREKAGGWEGMRSNYYQIHSGAEGVYEYQWILRPYSF